MDTKVYHRKVAASACAMVRTLQESLDSQIRLSAEVRADALGRGIAVGIVAAFREAPPEHAVLRLRALAAWLLRAADRIEGTLRADTPAEAGAALERLAARREGSP